MANIHVGNPRVPPSVYIPDGIANNIKKCGIFWFFCSEQHATIVSQQYQQCTTHVDSNNT